MTEEHRHTAPRDCPVCGNKLSLTRLSCGSCGTDLSGTFESCEFCVLGSDERQALRVFLASRGNMRELERHLGVSYPTARVRFDALLGKLGIEPVGGPVLSKVELMQKLAKGEVGVDEALEQLK